MLEALGLNPCAETVYLSMVKYPETSVEDLAHQLELGEWQIREALDELSRMSLLQASLSDPGELRPVDPSSGLQLLFARRQHELEASKRVIEILAMEHAELIFQRQGKCVEFLEGSQAVHSRTREIVRSCQWEVCSFVLTGPQTQACPGSSEELDKETMDRGVHLRKIFLDSVRNDPFVGQYAQWLSDAGGDVRTVPALPLQMLIIDRTKTLVHSSADNTDDNAILLSSDGVVAGLFALFHSVWRSATPLGLPRQRAREELSPQRKQALLLLAAGHTDETMARRLGVSVRTARRVASDLLARLNARSRFQAGARAVACGWISPDDLDAW